MPDQITDRVDQVVIHMYKMGTGDCFVLKFKSKGNVTFKMLIDCGCWNQKRSKIEPFIKALRDDVEGHVDVLVVTHEHTDHVLGFEAAEDIFTADDFKIDRIWMGWPENDAVQKIKTWKRKYGDKKKAMALAAKQLQEKVKSADFEKQFEGSRHANQILALRRRFSAVLSEFAELHVSGGTYVDGLKGMQIVKTKLAKNNVDYHKPGDVLQHIPGLPGIRIYVLGPPERWKQVKQESGDATEAYEHNDELEESDLFMRALDRTLGGHNGTAVEPFEKSYVTEDAAVVDGYKNKEAWRRIDDDWLFSAGAFALRMNELTNNLSLVLAFEFIDNNPVGKVMLFPGDAEIGSWKSWQDIKWKEKGFPDLSTEKLLNQVVFYKVAHHLSHNGTARSVGLNMMTHPDLVAMATLDYKVISDGWKTTMPNRHIIRDLLEKTKGRTMIMNENGLHFDGEDQIPLTGKIAEFREQKMSVAEKKAFEDALDNDSIFYMEYVLSL